MYNIAIIGSRSYNNYDELKTFMDKSLILQINKIISGGAKGADSLGARWAKEHNLELVEYLPDWDRYGKSAGFKRNTTIIENSDIVVAFWDEKSKGTADSIRKARELGLDIIIYNYETGIVRLEE